MKKLQFVAIALTSVISQFPLAVFAEESGERARAIALSVPLTGGVELKLQNGAKVIHGARRVRYVRHYTRAHSGTRARRYYLVKRNVNAAQTQRIGNKVLTRPNIASGEAGAQTVLPNSVAPLIIHGVNNLEPGKHYVEVVLRNGQYVIKQSGEVDPYGEFLEVIDKDGQWYIKGTDIKVETSKVFLVNRVPDGVLKYAPLGVRSLSPSGNYVEYVDSLSTPGIPIKLETVPTVGAEQFVELHDVPVSAALSGPYVEYYTIGGGNGEYTGQAVPVPEGIGTPAVVGEVGRPGTYSSPVTGTNYVPFVPALLGGNPGGGYVPGPSSAVTGPGRIPSTPLSSIDEEAPRGRPTLAALPPVVLPPGQEADPSSPMVSSPLPPSFPPLGSLPSPPPSANPSSMPYTPPASSGKGGAGIGGVLPWLGLGLGAAGLATALSVGHGGHGHGVNTVYLPSPSTPVPPSTATGIFTPPVGTPVGTPPGIPQLPGNPHCPPGGHPGVPGNPNCPPGGHPGVPGNPNCPPGGHPGVPGNPHCPPGGHPSVPGSPPYCPPGGHPGVPGSPPYCPPGGHPGVPGSPPYCPPGGHPGVPGNPPYCPPGGHPGVPGNPPYCPPGGHPGVPGNPHCPPGGHPGVPGNPHCPPGGHPGVPGNPHCPPGGHPGVPGNPHCPPGGHPGVPGNPPYCPPGGHPGVPGNPHCPPGGHPGVPGNPNCPPGGYVPGYPNCPPISYVPGVPGYCPPGGYPGVPGYCPPGSYPSVPGYCPPGGYPEVPGYCPPSYLPEYPGYCPPGDVLGSLPPSIPCPPSAVYAPPCGSGSVPRPVTPGHLGCPEVPPSDICGVPLAMGGDKATVNNYVMPYLTSPPSTSGYDNGSINGSSGGYGLRAPAAVVPICPNGAPTKRWGGQRSYDYGRAACVRGSASQLNDFGGKLCQKPDLKMMPQFSEDGPMPGGGIPCTGRNLPGAQTTQDLYGNRTFFKGENLRARSTIVPY